MTTTVLKKRGRHRDAGPGSAERAKGLVTVASALVIGLVASGATWSAFNAQTANSNNQFNTGTVTITDNSSGAAMFTSANLRPGVPVSKCIKVTYTGSLSAGVKLYGSTTGTLSSYLTLQVTRGDVSSGAFGDCTNFTPDAATYGLGPGVLYSGPMTSFPSSLGGAVADPNSSWSQNEAHFYRFTVDVADDNAAEGKSATSAFTWDAR
jgi:predicted ribosomally synthesized peptide with SipW-like signal peptide